MTAAIFDFADIHARLQNGFRELVKVEAIQPAPVTPQPLSPREEYQQALRALCSQAIGANVANSYAGNASLAGMQALNQYQSGLK